MAPSKSKSKSKLKPQRYHGYSAVLFVLGSLLPPLAVAARFGIGADFWLNLVLTICGYIPGHMHNFYIQNVRNNQNNRRTPKWVQRYGLVNTEQMDRKKKKSEWSSRYNDRLPNSTLEGAPYEEGQAGPTDPSMESLGGPERRRTAANGEFWNEQEESYYGQQQGNQSSSTVGGGRWHYPANFDDAVPASEGKKKKGKKEKKDRWARTEDAYSINEDTSRKKKKKKSRSATNDDDTYSRTSGSQAEFPEDPEGGLYGGSRSANRAGGDLDVPVQRAPQDEFAHEF